MAELDADSDDGADDGGGIDVDDYNFADVTSDEFRARHCVANNLMASGLQVAVQRIRPAYSTSILFDANARGDLEDEWRDRAGRSVYVEGRAYTTDDTYDYVTFRRIGRGNQPTGWTLDNRGTLRFRYTITMNGNIPIISHFHKMGTGAGQGLDKVDGDGYESGLRGAEGWFD